MKLTITPFSAVCVFVSVALAEGGKIEHTTFHSQALEKNMLGDSPTREVLVYLPPSYDSNEAKRYPVSFTCCMVTRPDGQVRLILPKRGREIGKQKMDAPRREM